MGRLLFSPPPVGAGDVVLIATDDAGETPAEIVSVGGGPVVTGGLLHAAGDGSLPRFLGPSDGTATLYALVLDYTETVTGDPVELTGVDLQAPPAPAAATPAADVPYDNTTSELTAEDVQAALDELTARVAALEAP